MRTVDYRESKNIFQRTKANRRMKVENSFYNTTLESGFRLRHYEQQAVSQEVQVLDFFEDNPNRLITRCELHRLILKRCPVSSITRALANLKKSGKIIRTSEKRDGMYGRPMFCWKLADAQRQSELFQ